MMRINNGIQALNFAMSLDAGGAWLYIAQYNGTAFTNRLSLFGNGDLFVTAVAAKPGAGPGPRPRIRG